MTQFSVAAEFQDLFEGRNDAWGAIEGRSVKEAVTLEHWKNHLWFPGHSLGIYPMGDDGMTHWGCSDIDFGYEESWPLALNLRDALMALGISSWIERTKGKGYHVWVFLSRCSDK